MAYAVGAIPEGKERITRLEMTWTISDEASRSRAFYSPWFGMDPGDNLNLIQPVILGQVVDGRSTRSTTNGSLPTTRTLRALPPRVGKLCMVLCYMMLAVMPTF